MVKIKKIRELKPKMKIVGAVEKRDEFGEDFEETHEGHFDETPSFESESFQNDNSRSVSPRTLVGSVSSGDSLSSPPARSDATDDETRNRDKGNDFRLYEIQRTFGNEANRYKSSDGVVNVGKSQTVSMRDSGQPRRDFFSSADQPGMNSTQSSNDDKYTVEKRDNRREKKGHGYAWEE